MANEYQNAFNSFNSQFEDGVEFEAHSGPHGQPATVVTSAQELYDYSETTAEEGWCNHLDSEGLELLVSLEDCLNGKDLQYVLEEQCENSFINGNFTQFHSQFDELGTDEFLDYLKDNVPVEREVEILRAIVSKNF